MAQDLQQNLIDLGGRRLGADSPAELCLYHGEGSLYVRPLVVVGQELGAIEEAPSSNTAFWIRKLRRNAVRDESNIAALQSLGWRVFVVWGCALDSGAEQVVARLSAGIIPHAQ